MASKTEFPRLIYAGNRKIGLRCLEILLEFGWKPVALLVAAGKYAEYSDDMINLVNDVPILRGKSFREAESIDMLKSLKPDYLLSVHFPYIIPKEVLEVPRIGALNLHPAYLPYNRGWHTPTWAILDGTPYGATLHWIDEGIDTGPIALRRPLEILPSDTAHSLYQRVLALEEELFREALPLMAGYRLPRIPQEAKGTMHTKRDIAKVQELNLQEQATIEELLTLLRALTTNKWSEAAYFVKDGVRYRVRVEIREESGNLGDGSG